MNFFKSKINWVGIITVVIGGLTAMQSLNLSSETMGYIMVAIGVLTSILRTFFLSSPISNLSPVKNDNTIVFTQTTP